MKARFQKLVKRENHLFSAFENWRSDFSATYHFHPEIELVAILGGNGRRIIGNHIETFGANDLVLIGEDVPHQYAGSSPQAHPRWAGSVVIQFLPEALGRHFLDSSEGKPVRTLLEKSGSGLAYPSAVAKTVLKKMRKLVAMDGPARFIALLEILHLLAESREARELASLGHSPALDMRNASRISRACEFIQRHFEEPISQADAAAHVGLSPSAFSRMFRRATGLTFTRFLTGVRLSEACRLLLGTDDTVAQICHRCGFSNLSNFNRRFLAAKKVTPREFRRASSITSI